MVRSVVKSVEAVQVHLSIIVNSLNILNIKPIIYTYNINMLYIYIYNTSYIKRLVRDLFLPPARDSLTELHIADLVSGPGNRRRTPSTPNLPTKSLPTKTR